MPDVKPCRAFELDALRGLALLLMVLHHLIFDLRHVFGLPVFAFQDTDWFAYLLQPLFLNVFLVVSGICCTFSRSNTRRGLRLLLVALALSAVSILASELSGQEFYIYFNVLHLLALGILLYAGLTSAERRQDRSQVRGDLLLLLAIAVVLGAAWLVPFFADHGRWWLLPLGLPPKLDAAMADYLPLVPWLGFFLVGTLIGRRVYPNRCSAFPGAPAWLLAISGPFALLGRHSLIIYVLHQPILLALLFGLRALGLI